MSFFSISPKIYNLILHSKSGYSLIFIPEGYTFKYTEGNNVSDRVPRIDLVIDIYWRVGLQKAYRAFLHRENPTFKIWQRMGFVVVIRSYGKGHKEI